MFPAVKRFSGFIDHLFQRGGAHGYRASGVENERVPPADTFGEEVANWLTHGFGFVLSMVGLLLLVVFAGQRGDVWHLASFTIFGTTLLILYGVSMTYHMPRRGARAKAVWRKIDHASIFLLIAGTYTPFLLTSLRGDAGWRMLGVIWALCGVGVVFQLLFAGRFRLVSTLLYLFAGWLILVMLDELIAKVPIGGVWLLVAGGLCYTFGIGFYLARRLRYHHAVWHAFVLGGSACHYFAVLLFLLPGAG